MVFTPYPNSNDVYENPNIVASADGDTWVVPDGLTNPIEAFPGDPWNYSDPCLFVDSESTMWCIFREADTNTGYRTTDRLYVKSSTDGVTWSEKALILTDIFNDMISPSVIWDGAQWVMYVIAGLENQDNRRLYRYTAAQPSGPWSERVLCPINVPDGMNPWHLKVFKDGDVYHAFIDERASILPHDDALFFAVSLDGIGWYVYRDAFLSPTASGWDSGRMYRTTGVRTATGYDLWYSAVADNGVWGIGRTTLTMEAV